MICYGSRDVGIGIWNLISLRRHIVLSHVIYEFYCCLRYKSSVMIHITILGTCVEPMKYDERKMIHISL